MTPYASPRRRRNRIRLFHSASDRAFMAIVYVVLALIFVVIAWPLLFVVSSSFSSPEAITSGRVVLWPVAFSTKGYETLLKTQSIVRSFGMSVFYTVVGTVVGIALTLLCAYPLSRKDLLIRGPAMFLFTLTMFISGGMIPTYLVVRSLRLVDTVWAMILPGAMSVWNMILTRTYMQSSIPAELFESASIDGCSDWRYFRSMVVPLSAPIIAVTVLLYAVGRWNSFFDALMYINTNRALYPLQYILRSILAQNDASNFELSLTEQMNKAAMKNLLQYALIVVTSVPVLILYPFIQRYFIRGIMVGSLKG